MILHFSKRLKSGPIQVRPAPNLTHTHTHTHTYVRFHNVGMGMARHHLHGANHTEEVSGSFLLLHRHAVLDEFLLRWEHMAVSSKHRDGELYDLDAAANRCRS